MKIRVEVDDTLQQNEVVVKCPYINDEVLEIQAALENIIAKKKPIIFYKDDTEYYFPLEEVLFFETGENTLYAHTINNVFQVKYKLYELEDLLFNYFVRVSKSTILNVHHIYSITRNISASSVVKFQHTHKQVYVSRHYYKVLKNKLVEMRK